MKKTIGIVCLSNLLFAESITLDNLSIEGTALDITTPIISQERALETRSISLQDKLERDVSFSTVNDEKGETAISFRGLDYKNTNYVEDGIPLYRSVNGFVDANFNMSSADIKMNDGSGVSSLGVSSTGGEVEIKSIAPKKELENSVGSSISNNDEFYHVYLGSLLDNFYIQTDASYYHRSDYRLSDDYNPTTLQQKGKRINSDKKQKNFSLKSGVFIDENLHLAVKASLIRSKYGMPPNIYTNITEPVWDAYSRIDKKELNSFNLYADYDADDLELSLRAYYDEYSDVFAIYNEPSYQSTLPLVTYDDSRLGSIVKANVTQNNTISTLILQVEENEHIRVGGGFDRAKNRVDTFKLSYLNELELSELWNVEAGASYTLMKETKTADASALNPPNDKKAFDAQIKSIYSDEKSSLYAAIAKKSRMPIMSEMFTFFPWDVASPDLKPEKSMQYTTGYKYMIDKKSTIDMSIYYYDISDLIIYRDSSFINRESAKHYGSELRFNSESLDNHNISFSYAYSKARDSENEALELIPKHQLKIEDSLHIYKSFNAYISYQFLSSRYSSNSATYTDEQMKLDAYHLLELQLAYKISKSIDTRLGVKNILDENYEWRYGYPREGRSYYVSLEWKL